jgi:hypothetical protein
VLRKLVIGQDRYSEPAARAAALDSIGMIGGPEAVSILQQVIPLEDDPTLIAIAEGLIRTLPQE